ncbi:MAG: hypothetical protein ACTSRA_21590, partial [Promethearchaeota archaeon]
LSRIDPIIKDFLLSSLKGRKKIVITDPLSAEEKGVDLITRYNKPLILKVKSFKEEIDQVKKYIGFLIKNNQLLKD